MFAFLSLFFSFPSFFFFFSPINFFLFFFVFHRVGLASLAASVLCDYFICGRSRHTHPPHFISTNDFAGTRRGPLVWFHHACAFRLFIFDSAVYFLFPSFLCRAGAVFICVFFYSRSQWVQMYPRAFALRRAECLRCEYLDHRTFWVEWFVIFFFFFLSFVFFFVFFFPFCFFGFLFPLFFSFFFFSFFLVFLTAFMGRVWCYFAFLASLMVFLAYSPLTAFHSPLYAKPLLLIFGSPSLRPLTFRSFYLGYRAALCSSCFFFGFGYFLSMGDIPLLRLSVHTFSPAWIIFPVRFTVHFVDFFRFGGTSPRLASCAFLPRSVFSLWFVVLCGGGGHYLSLSFVSWGSGVKRTWPWCAGARNWFLLFTRLRGWVAW